MGIFNVAPKQEMFFFFLSYSKRVCQSVHTECCEHRKLYNGGGDDYGGPTSQLPNEILNKIIDFALTGTDISIIITYNSLWQLGEPLKNSQCVIIFVGYHE